MSTALKQPVTIRPTEDLHSRLADAAAWMGVSLNNFVLEAAAERADLILQRRQSISLTEEDAQFLLDALEKPAQPNAALQRAFEDHKKLFDGQD